MSGFVADGVPAFPKIVEGGVLEVFDEDDAGIAFDALIAGVLGGDAFGGKGAGLLRDG